MLGTWVLETTASTGTGNLTLGGAISGFNSINSAFGNDSSNSTNPFQYLIWNTSNSEKEEGIGHLSTSSVLVRDAPMTSVSFSAGTKYVAVGPIGRGLLPVAPQVNTSATKRLVWTGAPHPTPLTTSLTISVDTIYYVPFLYAHHNKVDGVWLGNQSGTTGSVTCGIFSVSASTGKPNRCLASNQLAMSATGKSVCSFASSLVLPPGWYFLAIMANSTAAGALALVGTDAETYSPYMTFLGTGASDVPIVGFTESYSYASSMPTTAGTLTNVTGAAHPILGLRVV